ncbi:MAG: hypothetical protein WCN95_12375 [bacterium]
MNQENLKYLLKQLVHEPSGKRKKLAEALEKYCGSADSLDSIRKEDAFAHLFAVWVRKGSDEPPSSYRQAEDIAAYLDKKGYKQKPATSSVKPSITTSAYKPSKTSPDSYPIPDDETIRSRARKILKQLDGKG